MVQRVARPAHIPPEGTKQRMLLAALLRGERVDPFIALMEFNLPTLHARASELRKMGWPVRAEDVAHPKLGRETVRRYFFDTHFRRWMQDNPDLAPSEYSGQEGRGKFAKDA